MLSLLLEHRQDGLSNRSDRQTRKDTSNASCDPSGSPDMSCHSHNTHRYPSSSPSDCCPPSSVVFETSVTGAPLIDAVSHGPPYIDGYSGGRPSQARIKSLITCCSTFWCFTSLTSNQREGVGPGKA